MSWMKQLADVYDNNIHQVGQFEERRQQRITLLPISHVTQNAQIEILITQDGQFKNAKVVDKENARTIVPTTTDSANRSGTKIAPYFIHDKLQYVAGDYVEYGGVEKYKENYKKYKDQMKKWAESINAPAKVKTIYAYIKKGQVIEDLVGQNILPVDDDRQVLNEWPKDRKDEKPDIYKLVQGGLLSAFVRFDVEHKTSDDPVVWEDKGLFDHFIDFLKNEYEQAYGYCYVSGKYTALTTQHGSGIRHAADRGKLISGNDHYGFTYRGRFSNATDAVQIGYDVSQKAHQALKWLIQRQGTNIDSRYFVSFGLEQPDVPDPHDSTNDFMKGNDVFAQSLQELGQKQSLTESLVSEELNKALQGVKHYLKQENLENVVVIALDAATSGRLAIVYYQHLNADLFYQAIFNWHQTCRWIQSFKEEGAKNSTFYIGTPSTYRIANAVYGSKADNGLKKDLYTRLLPCIIEEQPIPKDIIRTIFNRVKNPFSFSNSNESWQVTLNIACALINKQYEREGYTVAVQEDNHSRDYLFGRLLGIAEVTERRVLENHGENRATNATRYFNAFAQRPARTWLVIRKQIAPYFENASDQTGYYKMLLQQVEDKLSVEQMTDDSLDPVFLLGYSSQIQDLYTKKGDKENETTRS